MKVYIGPYRSHWTSQIHYDYMNKKYNYEWPEYGQKGLGVNEEPFKEVVLRKIEESLDWLYDKTLNKIQSKRPRKIKVKLHDYDTWSMDHTLAVIVVPLLKQLKATKHGAPFVDMEDRPDHLKSDEIDPVDMTDKYHFEAWNWVIDELIWTFEQKALDDWEAQYYTGKWVEDPSRILGGHFVGVDREAMKAHGERIKNGLRLFGRYYEGLWD